MARHKKLIQKYIGFPLFHTATNAFTFPLTHGFLKDFSGLDNLSLDLQFATDKTLTARKGPTPVFTRASGATQVGASGLIEFAPENQLLHSENFKNTTSSSYWENQTTTSVTVDQTTSPDGGNNADLLVTSTTSFDCYTRRSIGYTGSNQYTYSIFLKQGPSGHRYVGLYIGVGISALQFPFFDFNDPTVVQIPSGTMTGTIDSTSVTAYPNGWYRVSATFTTAATPVTNYAGVYISTSNGTLSSSNTAGLNAYIWGIQLERHSTARTYIPTTTAAINTARFDHDPITLACKGLLIEESRTNTGLQSEAFETITWDAGGLGVRNLTVATNDTTSPSGSTTADKLTVGATTTVYQVVQNTPTLTSGTVYTVSCYVKANQVTRVNIWSGNTTTIPFDAYFDLTGNGAVTANAFGTASIQKQSNGWYRCIITATAGASASSTIRISPATTGNSRTYTGNSVDSFYAWGYQLEVGAFPTSYIPTTTASVVRSADICSITGANFTSFYNQSEGTVYTESRPAAVNGTTTSFSLSNGTANERWLNRFAQNEQVVITSAGTESAFDLLNPVAGTLYKTATAGKLNDFALSINGLAVVTDTSQPMPNADRAGLGNPTGAVAGGGAVTIASIRYYKKRLANAKLVTLTA